jgi:hypothetical protein
LPGFFSNYISIVIWINGSGRCANAFRPGWVDIQGQAQSLTVHRHEELTSVNSKALKHLRILYIT